MNSRAASLAVVSILLVTTTPVHARPAPGAVPARSLVLDFGQRFDGNSLSMALTNAGSFGLELTQPLPGLEYPKGSGQGVLYAGGLWIGAKVGGVPRVTVAEYSFEYAPGPVVNGAPADPLAANRRVYELLWQYPTTFDRDTALAAYAAGAVPDGAPAVTPIGDLWLNTEGDQVLWSVFNDLDPARHSNGAGSTEPLGVEVRHTVYGYQRGGALGHAIFMQYEIINRGPNTLTDAYVGIWSDPDIGDGADDLVGCDSIAGIGYCYNATNSDLVYGSNPPALGIDLIRGPRGPDGSALGMTAFGAFGNGTDPASPAGSYNALQGLRVDGSVIVNPVSGDTTRFMYPGDPVQGTGWLDSGPADRRMMLSSGPFTMAPQDTQVVRVAIVIGQAGNRLASIGQMRLHDQQVQAWDDAITPVAVSLVEASAFADRARLVWLIGDDPAPLYTVQRRTGRTGWEAIGTAAPDGMRKIVYEDPTVAAGERYGYRLEVPAPAGREHAGETWLSIPTGPGFDLFGARPHPTRGRVVLAFALPDEAPARIELIDLAGRVSRSRDVGSLGPGTHVVDLGATGDLPAGVYFARLTRSAEVRVARVCVME